mmetsp:Transcript_10691/g.28352  ORF Transcript_10691/g.28352 Transcript_10691/m.28352 type:complete len:221 (+) Transcript_10691:1695-2357(+)
MKARPWSLFPWPWRCRCRCLRRCADLFLWAPRRALDLFVISIMISASTPAVGVMLSRCGGPRRCTDRSRWVDTARCAAPPSLATAARRSASANVMFRAPSEPRHCTSGGGLPPDGPQLPVALATSPRSRGASCCSTLRDSRWRCLLCSHLVRSARNCTRSASASARQRSALACSLCIRSCCRVNWRSTSLRPSRASFTARSDAARPSSQASVTLSASCRA